MGRVLVGAVRPAGERRAVVLGGLARWALGGFVGGVLGGLEGAGAAGSGRRRRGRGGAAAGGGIGRPVDQGCAQCATDERRSDEPSGDEGLASGMHGLPPCRARFVRA